MAEESQVEKILLAFDFDHTVLDGNSDVEVQKLHPQPFPDHVSNLYSGRDWNRFMAAIFDLLHKTGVTPDAIRDNILSLPLVSGMKELMSHLSQHQYEVIIISDANTQFIDWHLQHHQLHFLSHVYSNPAKFTEEGKLSLDFYHHQDWCDLCSKNLCKGNVLEGHIRKSNAAGISYSKIYYIGDGHNDYCPSLKLSPSDYVFPRVGYALHRKIAKDGSQIKAKVVPWECASTILKVVQAN